MNWNCLIWSIMAMFGGIISVLVEAGIAEPLDTRELTFLLLIVCMICAIVYAIDAAKEDDEDGDQDES